MSFRDKLNYFAESIEAVKPNINDEETTKHSLVLPFLQILGYNIFNPAEIKPEYTSDVLSVNVDKRKKEKVDYAILKNNQPLIFIECKSIKDSVRYHSSQLTRYFNATPICKFAVFTNGIIYKFFTDRIHHNLMDEEPFYEFNLERLTEADYEFIELITKYRFTVTRLMDFVKEMFGDGSGKRTYRASRKPGRPGVMGVERFTVTIDKELIDAFNEFAQEKRINKSALLRKLIRDYLKQQDIAIPYVAEENITFGVQNYL